MACGAPGAPPTARVEPALEDLVPDGATSVLRLRPHALMGDDATMRVVEAIVPAARLDAFRDRHGIELRDVEVLAHASYEGAGSILLGRGPFHADVVVTEIGHRMAPLESSEDVPLRRRAGIYLMRRFELIALGPHDVGLVEGPPALAGLLLHTRARAASSATTEAPPRARRILDDARDAPFLFVRHGRPALPPDGIGLLLARLEDAALFATPAGPSDPGAIALGARLFGEFPPGADENFRALVRSLADADLGRAVGLEEVARTLVIDTLEGEIQLGAHVRAATVARGLRVLLGAEIEEMLDDAT